MIHPQHPSTWTMTVLRNLQAIMIHSRPAMEASVGWGQAEEMLSTGRKSEDPMRERRAIVKRSRSAT